MKSYLFISIIVCLLQIISCELEIKDYYDLNDEDQHVHVVQLIFSKLNTILTETAQITQRLAGYNERFDEFDQRLDKILQDFSNFKTDITKRVHDQATSVENTLMSTENCNKRADEIEKRVSTSANEILSIRRDITKTAQERNEAFKKSLNEMFGEITQLLKKSSNDIKVFKSDISKPVEEHSAAHHQKVNETLQHREITFPAATFPQLSLTFDFELFKKIYSSRQQNQIKLLWEHGSLKTKTEWNVILRRINGSIDFNRNWTEYKNGFGDPAGEFFVGLEILHRMTTNGLKHELLIEMKDADNHLTYAKYDNFVIGSEQEKYMLKEVGNHSGDAEDALTHHMDEKFTTLDQDTDMAAEENCAKTYKGPWWFYQCNPSSNLFGPYQSEHLGYRMRWGPSILNELKFIEVKIRQV